MARLKILRPMEHSLHFTTKNQLKRVYGSGRKTQTAPAQRVTDFLNGKVSTSLPATSYIPGVTSVDLKGVLPAEITIRLKEALKIFNSKLKGYITDEAIMLATESRTSSPVRIPRDRITKTHPQISNLYPCAEGAGYAGASSPPQSMVITSLNKSSVFFQTADNKTLLTESTSESFSNEM